MSKTTLTLTALALCLAVCWVASFVACWFSTNPVVIGFWMVCGITNGLFAFNAAEHAIESHVKGW